jgi:hypothetical protein
MPNERSRIPCSYDEIVRRTVVDPDSSFRPSQRQEAEADEPHRAERVNAQMSDRERDLYARLAGVLLADTSLGEIGFEVEDGTVTLQGSVRDARAITHIEDLARGVEGVDRVVNRLVVRA